MLAYDYTVLAGTQGVRNHKKADRMIGLAGELGLPVVLFAEGGGGRPGDTDRSELFHLDVLTFREFARLSGLVPRIGIVSGRCFAGNASLLGCCDVIIATPESTIGMGGPAMIEGGGLGSFAPEEVGPARGPGGERGHRRPRRRRGAKPSRRRSATSRSSRAPVAEWECADQERLRGAVPEDPKRTHDARALLRLLADTGSALELRAGFGRTIVTALARIEGRAVGVIANDPAHLSGAIDADGSDKAARFIQLCDAFGLPVVSLVDTPGFMVGPESERTAMVRRSSRLFLAAASASVPFVSVVVRRAFGLGAQAMTGGAFHAPVLNVAWPSGEFGAMGVEGAVRLALRKELDEIPDPAEREHRVRELVASVRAESTAINMAAHFEIDDVIDPATTRGQDRRRARRGAAGCHRAGAGHGRFLVSTRGGQLRVRRRSRAPAGSTGPRRRSGDVPCVVMAHGFSLTRHDGLDLYARRFADAGLSALVFDYRYLGDSGGEPRQRFRKRDQLADWERAIEFARRCEGIDGSRTDPLGLLVRRRPRGDDRSARRRASRRRSSSLRT